MKKERSIKELLIILRDNLKPMMDMREEHAGMCSIIYDMYMYKGLINASESLTLNNYLYDHKPKNAILRSKKYEGIVSKGECTYALSEFWWTPKAIAPRLKWLNQQIESL